MMGQPLGVPSYFGGFLPVGIYFIRDTCATHVHRCRSPVASVVWILCQCSLMLAQPSSRAPSIARSAHVWFLSLLCGLHCASRPFRGGIYLEGRGQSLDSSVNFSIFTVTVSTSRSSWAFMCLTPSLDLIMKSPQIASRIPSKDSAISLCRALYRMADG